MCVCVCVCVCVSVCVCVNVSENVPQYTWGGQRTRFCCCCCFDFLCLYETGCHYKAQTGLEIGMETQLVLSSEYSACLCLRSTLSNVVCHHSQPHVGFVFVCLFSVVVLYLKQPWLAWNSMQTRLASSTSSLKLRKRSLGLGGGSAVKRLPSILYRLYMRLPLGPVPTTTKVKKEKTTKILFYY